MGFAELQDIPGAVKPVSFCFCHPGGGGGLPSKSLQSPLACSSESAIHAYLKEMKWIQNLWP